MAEAEGVSCSTAEARVGTAAAERVPQEAETAPGRFATNVGCHEGESMIVAAGRDCRANRSRALAPAAAAMRARRYSRTNSHLLARSAHGNTQSHLPARSAHGNVHSHLPARSAHGTKGTTGDDDYGNYGR